MGTRLKILLILFIANSYGTVYADTLDFFLCGYYPKGRYEVFYNKEKIHEFSCIENCTITKKISIQLPDSIKDESNLDIIIKAYIPGLERSDEMSIRYSSFYKYILIIGCQESKKRPLFFYYVWTNERPIEDDYIYYFDH